MTDSPLQLFRRLTRVFVDPDAVDGGCVHLDEPRARHLVRVLRRSDGDQIAILDGEGRAWIARLRNCSKSRAVAEILFPVADPGESLRHVEIALPPLKGERMEVALQKCTEIGVCAFHMVPMERSVARIREDSEGKAHRFKAILTSAAEQCGAFRIPQIRIWHSLNDFLSQIGPALRYIAWEEHSSGLPGGLTGGDGACILASGPEGGLSEAEVERWKDAGFAPVGLGHRVLRAETAPIVLAALALCANSGP